MNKLIFQNVILLSALLFSLIGCSTTQTSATRYFSLTPIQPSQSSHAVANDLSLGIGPVEIPRLLNRPQIIYRKNNNEILLSENNQWAGSLREEIQETLIESVIDVSGSQQIMPYPWARDLRPEFEVRIRIDRLDGMLGKEVILEAHWDLLTQKDKGLIMSRKSYFKVGLDDKDFLNYVIAQQTLLTQFADEILEGVVAYKNTLDDN